MNFKTYTLATMIAFAQAGCYSTMQENLQRNIPIQKIQEPKISPWIHSDPIDIGSHNKPILLDFWLPSCEPCINAFPKIEEYAAGYKKEITIIGVVPSRHATGPIQYIQQQLEEISERAGKKIIFPHYVDDGPLHTQFDVQAYPCYVLIDTKKDESGNKIFKKIRFENIESELEKTIQ